MGDQDYQASIELYELDFIEIGYWELMDDSIVYKTYDDHKKRINHPNILYAFVETDQLSNKVRYIGKTTKTLKNRFIGYCNPGNSSSTNQRVNSGIKKCLENGKEVSIFVFRDVAPLQWSGVNLNVAAGIEDGLINRFNPEWNVAGNSKRKISTLEELENERSTSANLDEDWEVVFSVKLGKTYYHSAQGFMNPGAKASQYLGEHGENVELSLPSFKLKSSINRRAVSNEAVRIAWGSSLTNWYNKNFTEGDVLNFAVLPGNKIKFLDKD